ncbi:hypothetical protein [Bilophila wadsworthia]|uniref:hypothetical protein n=1 Tax=Bilophila wadsworthia TaxID=35833 RepID=UPI003990DAA8
MNGSSPTTALSCSTKALPALQGQRTGSAATTERPDIQLASVDSEEQPISWPAAPLNACYPDRLPERAVAARKAAS